MCVDFLMTPAAAVAANDFEHQLFGIFDYAIVYGYIYRVIRVFFGWNYDQTQTTNFEVDAR